jgi:hypothetical protein
MVKGFAEIFDLERFLDISKMHFFFSYEDIPDMIIWALSHLIIECVEYRPIVLKSDVFKEIMKLAKKEELSRNLMKTISWFLSTIFKCKTGEMPSLTLVKEIINVFSGYLYCKDNEIVIYSIWGLSHICELSYPCIQKLILDSGVVVKIMSVVPNYNQYIIPVVTLLGNLLSGDDEILDV